MDSLQQALLRVRGRCERGCTCRINVSLQHSVVALSIPLSTPACRFLPPAPCHLPSAPCVLRTLQQQRKAASAVSVPCVVCVRSRAERGGELQSSCRGTLQYSEELQS
jgi:hypothetical protein